MIIEVTLNRTKVSREIPISWETVTFKQFLELETCKNDYVKVMALFTGIEADLIRTAKIKNLDSVITALGFLKTEPIQKRPTKLMGYDIPPDLGFESIAQFEDVKASLKDSKDMTLMDHLNRYPLYCAIYACNPYNWKKAEEMQSIFFNAPCQEVLGIGNFTLAKLIGLNLSIGKRSHPRLTLPRKFRLALTVWRMRLAFMVRSFIWKIRPEQVVKNS